jgi:hypothetical protein
LGKYVKKSRRSLLWSSTSLSLLWPSIIAIICFLHAHVHLQCVQYMYWCFAEKKYSQSYRETWSSNMAHHFEVEWIVLRMKILWVTMREKGRWKIPNQLPIIHCLH